MLRKFLGLSGPRLAPRNENALCEERRTDQDQGVPVAKIRALATGAALAASVDNSLVALVSIYDCARSHRGVRWAS